MTVTKAKIIKNNNDDVKTLTQTVTEVHKNYLTVVSRKGNIYNVNLSDIVKMTMTVNEGDTAVIKTFPNGWLVTDIIPKPQPKVLSAEEEKAETERQIREFEELLGGY